MRALERCNSEKIDRETGKIVDAVENEIQNAIFTAIDGIITPEIELAITSINSSSGQDATSVMANSQRGEHRGITTFSENLFKSFNILNVSTTNN